ncbi:MAG: ATP synthase F0 subunit B [Oscillospiraceae bacterium]
MSINISETIWTVINFFVLMYLLNIFLFKPIFRFMDAHKDLINNALENNGKTRLAMEENTKQQAMELRLIDNEAKRILNDARTHDEMLKLKALSDAHEDAAVVRSLAGAHIIQEEKATRENVQENMPQLVSALIVSLLGDEKAAVQNKELIGSLVLSSYADE